MTHLAYQADGRTLTLEADYVVVGSGAGGATAAVTLARGGGEVALIEAGPLRDPDDYPHSFYGAMRDMLADWGSVFTRGRAMWPVVQGALVGGSTVINSAICVRTPGDVIARWERDHGVGGEALATALWRIQDELEAELHAESAPRAAIGRNNRLAMEAARALALESHYTKRYVHACEGRGQCLQGCRAGRKQSLNLSFVPEVLRRSGTLLSCARVARVLIDNGRAIGVEGRFVHPQTRARGARFVVRARRAVLVAASVTRTPLILMASGVRSHALGRYLRAHPGLPMIGVYDSAIDMNSGATQGWSSLAFRHEGVKLESLGLPLDMLAGRLSGGGAQLMQRLVDFRHLAVWVLGVRAEAAGEVRPGLFGKPSVRYTAGPDDMRRMRAGLTNLARMHFAVGARAVLPGIYGLPHTLGPDGIDQLANAPIDPRAYTAILSHLFGGAVMGRDAARSVCDGEGRVHGYEGLYVADASAIPTPLGVNPQHTIMALARYFAERLLAREQPRALGRARGARFPLPVIGAS